MDYIPHNQSDIKKMLKTIGVKSIDELFEDIPKESREVELNIPQGLTQLQLIRFAQGLAKKNINVFEYISFLGAGAYEHSISPVVEKITSLPGFLTAYTPYQAEASQGTLRTIFEYQTLVSELTGMEVSNASMYDGSTALTEAVAMALNLTGKREILLPRTLHPEYGRVLKALLRGLDARFLELPYLDGITDLEILKNKISPETAAVVIQQPNFFGCLEEMEEIEKIVHNADSLLIVCCNPVSLGILKRPGDYSADLVVGEGQPLGIPLNFGGPYLGFFAGPKKWIRQIPGRIAGLTEDKEGKTAFTLVLQTREQHIRRDRATSNICTNSNLNAVAFTVALSLLGQKGLKELAVANLQKAHYLQERISEIPGFKLKFTSPFFNEFVIESKTDSKKLKDKLLSQKIVGGLELSGFYPELENCLLFCATEIKNKDDLDYLISTLSETETQKKTPILVFEMRNPNLKKRVVGNPRDLIPQRFIQEKKPKIPKIPEADLINHFIKRSEENYSVDTHFYPLGSCTMKLNPKENEALASLPRFTLLHPYLPEAVCQGTLQILYETERMLSEICGMKRFSLQPAAGAHGELVGLLIIKTFHRKQGNRRKIILIPDSAHGTNPASASRSGFQVVTVKSTKEGEIDLADLEEKVNSDVAGLMITFPNTLGLFERDILEITKIVHQAGGLVYMDGANMNALLGIAKPGEMGIDVLHLNLHKTFSAPHGGGGPGSGPVGVVEKLAPFLPMPLIEKEGGKYFLNYDLPDSIGKVVPFYGNTNVIIKSYLYIKSLGNEGLKWTAQNAVLNANYLLAKLKEHYLLPYDRNCAHECVFSAQKQGKKLGQGAAGMISKRLLDYGFHAPTNYFPTIVPESLMIEPTETEDKETLDRFVEVMIKINEEIEKSPELVKGAPHTTPVKRVDQVAADRNLVVRHKKP